MKQIPKFIIAGLQQGKISIIPTDTIYGLVGSALRKKTVQKIYKIRERNTKKPFIVLISQIKDLHLFGVRPNYRDKKILHQLWPGPVSIILPCPKKQLNYLHRGQKSLAFRLPQPLWLRNLIKQTGPLVAPSANPEGKPPATVIKTAKKYFGSQIDFYLDGGEIQRKPSSLIYLKNGVTQLRRKGLGIKKVLQH